MNRMLCGIVLLASLASARIMWVRVYYDGEFERRALVERHYDILTGNARQDYFEYFLDESAVDELNALGYAIEIIQPDVRNYLERTYGHQRMTFGYYYTYAEMEQEVDQIVAAYPALAQKIDLGTTWQGRTIWGLKISDNVAVTEPEPRVLFVAAQHAREPIGCSILLDFAKYLTQQYGVSDTASTIVNNDEVLLVPVANPDGYVFNETYNDYWGYRKNGRDNDNNGSFDPTQDGVDLNRNYTYMWGYDNSGSSPDPTADDYRGPSAASEPEVQAVIARCVADSFLYAMDYHSYGDYLMYPWGYIDALPPDSDLYQAMADTMTTQIGLPNNYVYGTPNQTVGYNANGGSFDYWYGEQTTKPMCFGWGCEVGAEFWEGANDTAIILQQCNETRPMNIYLCLRAAIIGIEEGSRVTITQPRLVPNPVRDLGTLAFVQAGGRRLAIRIYDAAGRVVMALPERTFGDGFNEVRLDTRGLAPGVYFVSASEASRELLRRKMVVIRD